jgi:hypothetical protein
MATGGVAALLLLGIVMVLSTEYGTVQITLHNADENVRVFVDGNTIAIDGLSEPLKLKVGEHKLVASSPSFESVTQSFRVKRDETTLLDVRFVPQAVPETAKPPTVPKPRSKDASKPAAPKTEPAVPPKEPDAADDETELDPILHFQFEGNTGNSGSLGGSHNGTAMGDGVFGPDSVRGNRAYDTASRGYITIPATKLGDRITIAVWAKLDQGVSNIQAILSSWTSTGGGFSLGLNSWTRNDRIVQLETWSPTGQSSGARTVANVVDYSKWHHVAVTMDRPSDSVVVYVDGALVQMSGGAFASDFTDNKPLSIGRYHGTPSFLPFHFNGLIDDLRVYNRILADTEIRALVGTRTSVSLEEGVIPESASSDSAYLVERAVAGIVRTSLASTIQTHGVPLTPIQLEAVAARDGVFLDEGVYHIFKLRNKGITQVEWTGYGSGNSQILLNYWDGSRMVMKDIRGARQNSTHRVPVSVPPSQEFLYVMVNCTGGGVFTDTITHDGD